MVLFDCPFFCEDKAIIKALFLTQWKRNQSNHNRKSTVNLRFT